MGIHGHRKSEAPETRGRTIRSARFYDLGTSLVGMGPDGPLRKKMLELADLRPGEKVLDAGCGTGAFAIAAKKAVGTTGEVHGIDAAPEMVEFAAKKARKAGVDASFKVGLIEHLDFEDGYFDAVTNSLVLHHLPEDVKRAGLSEIHRVLKPGGRFVALDFSAPEGRLGHALAVLSLHGKMMKTDIGHLTPKLEEAGFADVETGPVLYHVMKSLKAFKPGSGA